MKTTSLSHGLLILMASLGVSIATVNAQVDDWFMGKFISYEQIADNTQPGSPTRWSIEVGVVTLNPGDATSATISGGGIAGSLALSFDVDEWVLDKNYLSQAAMDAEFPSGANYTLTLSGGTLGTLVQNFTMPVAVYPNVPYLTSNDFTKFQSLNATVSNTLNWNDPGAQTTGIVIEITDPETDNEVVEFEIDQATLPLNQVIGANVLSPGGCYRGLVEFFNTATASNAGGFGAEGFLEHAYSVNLEVQAVLSRTPQEIVGAWQFGDGAEDNSGVLVFLANGVYFHGEDVALNSGDDDGMERGTYTWNSSNGDMTASVNIDTNGNLGLSNPDGDCFVTVNGDQLTVTDNTGSSVLTRVGYSSVNPLLGGWRICDNAGSDTGVLVFLSNDHYYHVQVGEVGDASTADGVERGTYVYNSGTGNLVATVGTDTNLELGLSHPAGAFVASSAGPRILTLSDGEASRFHRISNAAVKPFWRLNKARGYNQTADNTPPATEVFWDIYGSVDVQNGSDVGALTITGGGVVGSMGFVEEDPGEWEFSKQYASKALLDTEFPDNGAFVLTISGGELGTMVQEINIGASAYPVAPHLVGTNFTDAKSVDPTEGFEFLWNNPNSSAVSIVVSQLQNEEGDEYFDTTNDNSIQGQTFDRVTMPALSMPAGQTAFGYLEFSQIASNETGQGGFEVEGFSARHSILNDFPIVSLGGSQLVQKSTASAGLTGEDAGVLAEPFEDGLANIVKYAFNLDLSKADSTPLTPGAGNSGLPAFDLNLASQSLVKNSPQSSISIEFVRRKGAGLIYTPMWATDLENASFQAMTGPQAVTPIDDEFERVVATQFVDPLTTSKAFARVRVEVENIE